MADERYIDEFAKQFANGIVEGQLSERKRIVAIVRNLQAKYYGSNPDSRGDLVYEESVKLEKEIEGGIK